MPSRRCSRFECAARVALLTLVSVGVGSVWLRPLPPHARLLQLRQLPADVAPPSESAHFGLEIDESRMANRRAAWLESLHRAAPGFDWRAQEVENRRALRAATRLRPGSVPFGTATPWRSIGPVDRTGRTDCTAFRAADGMLLLGSPGGVWRGTLGSDRWEALEGWPLLDCVGLSLVPGYDRRWIGYGSVGPPHVSRDDGGTWEVPAGLPAGGVRSVRRVLAGPGAPGVVYLLVYARTAPYTGPGFFLLRSADGGLHFSTVHAFPGHRRPDIWQSRVAPSDLFCALDRDFLRSSDQGRTFETIGNLGRPVTDPRLMGSEAGAPTFYLFEPHMESQGLLRSNDGGRHWMLLDAPADYLFSADCSTRDPARVFLGAVDAWVSRDAGAEFEQISRWFDYSAAPDTILHADIRGMDTFPWRGGEALFLSTDGGTYLSTDGGNSVRLINRYGMRNAQIYSLLTRRADPWSIHIGTQDQGYAIARADEPHDALGFSEAITGDYGHLTTSAADDSLIYADYPDFILVSRIVSRGSAPGRDSYRNEGMDFPERNTAYPFLPFLLAHPADPRTVIYCERDIWRMTLRSRSAFTATPLHASLLDGDSLYNYVAAVAISPADTSRWYALTARGIAWSSSDAGRNWRRGRALGTTSSYLTGAAVAVSPTDPDTCYFGGSGYSNAAVYRTCDGGATWEEFGAGLPPTLVYDIAFDSSEPPVPYLATESGPYRFDAARNAWESLLDDGAPLIACFDLEWVPALGVMRFGTYGRGIWDFYPAEWAVAHEGRAPGATMSPGLRLTPNPAAGPVVAWLQLAAAGPMRLDLLDVQGRLVRSVVEEVRAAGALQRPVALLDAAGRPLPDGIYFVRLSTRGSTVTRKLVVLKRPA